MRQMDRADLDGVELEYELRGSGEPVVLVHWGVCAAWSRPLLEARALSHGFRLISYHRARFVGSREFFGQELPALQQWSFTQEDASRIAQPVLAVSGENSASTSSSDENCCSPGCRMSSRSTSPMRPTFRTCRTPGMAEALAAFFAKHPLPTAA
jgi:pimeloyl-ACP methyl ester carboxylesterase